MASCLRFREVLGVERVGFDFELFGSALESLEVPWESTVWAWVPSEARARVTLTGMMNWCSEVEFERVDTKEGRGIGVRTSSKDLTSEVRNW